MLYVDGMNGVINHNETVQWLYSLTASKVCLDNYRYVPVSIQSSTCFMISYMQLIVEYLLVLVPSGVQDSIETVACVC
jgi:hypothetical protein